MAKQTINLGSGPDSYTGDSLNVAFTKINENFTELYAGNVVGNIRSSGNIIANTSLRTDGFIRGDSLEIISNASVLGTISANNFTYANGVALGNFSNVTINTSGNITGNTITATSFSGSGTFTDVVVTGNLSVNGTTTFIDVTRTNISDPIVEIGGNSAGGALTSNDAKDRGFILHYYNGAARDAFLGWDASSSEFRIASNAIVVNNEVLLYDTYANVRAGYFIGNGSQLSGVSNYSNANAAAYAAAGWAGNIIPSANVTYSLGNVTNQWRDLWVSNNTIYISNVPLSITQGNVLTINGNPILSNNSNANISTAGTITANSFVGDGSLLTNVAATGNLLIEGTVITLDAGTADLSDTILNISPSEEGWAYLQIPNDVTANTANTRLWNAAGNVEIGAGDFSNGGTSYRWDFDKTGNLTLPQTGVIGEQPNPSGFPGHSVFVKPSGYLNDNQQLLVYPTGGNDFNHLHLTSGDLYDTELYLGNDNLYVKLSNTGNIEVRTDDNSGNSAQWTFSTDGNLTLPGNINATGDVIANSLFVVDSIQPASFASPAPSISGFDSISAANISANYFIGDGSQLTGLPAAYSDSNVTSLLSSLGSNVISTTGNISGNFVAPASTANTQILFNDSGRIGGVPQFTFDTNGNTLTLAGSSTLKVADIQTPSGALRLIPSSGITYSYGNLHPLFANTYSLGQSSGRWQNFYTNTANIVTLDTIGNITSGGNVSVGNLITANTGNIILGGASSYLKQNSSNARISLSGSVTLTPDTNADAASGVIIGGNGYLLAPNGSRNAVLNYGGGSGIMGIYTLNVYGNTATAIHNGGANGVGNIGGNTSNRFNTLFALAADLTGNLTAGNILTNNFYYANGTPFVPGSTYTDSNVTSLLAALGSNSISTTGNVSGGNLITTGSVNVDGNVNLTGAEGSDTARIFADVTGANTSLVLEVGDDSEDNIVLRHYSYSAGTAIDMLTAQRVSNTAANISVAGNLTATSNITAANFIGNIQITGNVTGTSTNVTLVAGSYSWTFNNAGNLVLPGNTFSINYANGAAVSLGSGGAGDYGDSNVVSLLSSFGSNTITTTGNVTAGILISNGTILGNPDIILGNTANASATKTRIVTDTTFSYIQTGNGTVGSTGNIVFSPYSSATQRVVINTASGDLRAYGNIYAAGNATTGNNSLIAGVSGTVLANSTAAFIANVNSYAQITYQNKNSGTDATADFILTADNGSDVTNYSDFGIINSGYDNATPTNSLGNIVYAADTYLYAQGNISNTGQSGGNLVIGTTTASKSVKIFAGGNTAAALVANISNVGVSITGSLTTTGNITTANITGTSANVTITANNFVSTFDTTGLVTLPGNLTVNGSGGISMPNLPAFRVYGTVGTQITANTTVNSTHGATIDYNQGSYYDNTTGIFTAPIAGLYHCYATLRVGSNNGLNQATIIKNNSVSGANVIAFWETDTNIGTAVHFSMTGYAKCAVGDTLRLRVLSGNINLDSNDSWGITYIG